MKYFGDLLKYEFGNTKRFNIEYNFGVTYLSRLDVFDSLENGFNFIENNAEKDLGFLEYDLENTTERFEVYFTSRGHKMSFSPFMEEVSIVIGDIYPSLVETEHYVNFLKSIMDR